MGACALVCVCVCVCVGGGGGGRGGEVCNRIREHWCASGVEGGYISRHAFVVTAGSVPEPLTFFDTSAAPVWVGFIVLSSIWTLCSPNVQEKQRELSHGIRKLHQIQSFMPKVCVHYVEGGACCI